MPLFEEQALLAEARRRTGLQDFGDEDFRPPLQVLLRSLDEEAGLSDAGRQGQWERLVQILVNRLQVEDWVRRHPEILAEEVAPPVAIVGLPRTGTTMLHRILSSDQRFYSPLWYEVRNPSPAPDWDFNTPDPRIAAAKQEVQAMLEGNPDLAAIHPMDATAPDEDIMLLEHSFYSSTPDAYCHVPSYGRWVAEHDNRGAYRYLRKLLQFLQWQKRRSGQPAARCWLLKTPHHLHFMQVLMDVFPGVRVIQTHRDPLETIPSFASFALALWRLGNPEAQPRVAAQYWSQLFAKGMRHTLQVRDQNPEAFLDIWYRDTVQDPFAVIERVYAFIGMDLTDQARAAMEAWQRENPREARPPHEYTLEEFGFTEAQIFADFKEYRDRYILTREQP